MTDKPPTINLGDRSTWVKPVETRREEGDLSRMFRAEYNIPICPVAIQMAIFLLPSDIPRDYLAFVRINTTKSNIKRDSQHRGGFFIELTWPKGDLDEFRAIVDRA